MQEEGGYPNDFMDQVNALQRFVLPTIRNVATAIQEEQVEYDTICETSSENTLAIIGALENSFCRILQANVSFFLSFFSFFFSCLFLSSVHTLYESHSFIVEKG